MRKKCDPLLRSVSEEPLLVGSTGSSGNSRPPDSGQWSQHTSSRLTHPFRLEIPSAEKHVAHTMRRAGREKGYNPIRREGEKERERERTTASFFLSRPRGSGNSGLMAPHYDRVTLA